jgi:PTH1 family peptidyl-tRNA hydrolase
LKYLITGLGNLGQEYHLTRHNIGFLVLDALAEELKLEFRPGRFGQVAEGRLKNKSIILLKPDTFMNLSGKAVKFWMQSEKVPLENILIVTDDLALPCGRLRLKGKGSDGGHNGLKSLAENLQTEQYPRLRFGIGSEFSKGKQIDYVLGTWTESELAIIENAIPTATETIKSFTLSGIERTMEVCNKKE